MDALRKRGSLDTRFPAGSGGQYMRVRTQYDFKFVTPIIGAFFSGGTVAVKAEATYHNELFN